MGEYANLQRWQKLDNAKGSVYEKYYNLTKKGFDLEKIFNELNLDFWEFGSLRFTNIDNQIYFNHQSMDLFERAGSLLEWKYDIPVSWLLAFSFDEFEVTSSGSTEDEPEFGSFFARTTAGKAISRILAIPREDQLKIGSSHMVDELSRVTMLLSDSFDDDIIVISAGMIYYSPDGKFGADYVKKDINEKVKKVLESIRVPHWKKCAASQNQ